ncbi:hypothetical protein TrRE_jg11211 [Triparma retinervis]|uniref:EF-hand domain-containing protein n=1 Tax=Triparma retinervis TaxID=2557542 RepID=A0A9W7CHQ2_9STRA|nr:hypothetical protein TrRE_jg11211 [Triparma retinervis]
MANPFFSNTLPRPGGGAASGKSQNTLGQKLVQATVEIGLSVIISAGLLYTFKALTGGNISSFLDPFLDPIGLKPEKGRKGAEARLHSILVNRAEKKNPSSPAKIPPLDLNSYELVIAESVLDPSTLSTPFSSIGGISSLKTQVYELCVLPLLRPDIFRAANVEVTKGVLLYGRPGTGKTMIAKAIASEGSALFINVKLSVIMNKYFGESNKMVSAVFSLARKLSPSLIFIDEIDTFLKQRDDSAEALGSMKSEFLTMWDGVNHDDGEGGGGIVMVMGATNRPYDVDQAILRRLPRQFEIPLPDAPGRLDILNKMLSGDDLDGSALGYLGKVAEDTEGFSGSDLRELVRCAKMERVTEITKEFSRRSKFGVARIVETKNTVSPSRLLVDPRKAKEIHDRNTSPRPSSKGPRVARSPCGGRPLDPSSRRLSFVGSHTKGEYLPLSPPSLKERVERVKRGATGEGAGAGARESVHDKNLMHVREVERKVKIVKEKRGGGEDAKATTRRPGGEEKVEKKSKAASMREEAKKMIVRRRVMKMLGLVKFEGDLRDLYKLAKEREERDSKKKKQKKRGKTPPKAPPESPPKPQEGGEVGVGSEVRVKFRLGSKDYDRGVVVRVEPSGKFTVDVNGVVREGVKKEYISIEKGDEEEAMKVDAEVQRKVKIKIRAAAMGRDLERRFKAADKDKKGSLDSEELRTFCRRVLKLTKNDVADEALEDLFAYLDKEGRGAVDWDTLMSLMDDDSAGDPTIGFGQAAKITSKLMGMKKRADDRLNKKSRSRSKSPTRGSASPPALKSPSVSPQALTRMARSRSSPRKTMKMIQSKLRSACYGRSLSSVFKSADRDHSGSLELPELKSFTRRILKIPPSHLTDDDLSLWFGFIDEDKSGGVEWDELRRFVRTTLKISNLTEEQIDALFYHLDDDESGSVDVGEIRKFMSADRRPRVEPKEVVEESRASESSETAETGKPASSSGNDFEISPKRSTRRLASSLSVLSEDGDDKGSGLPQPDVTSEMQLKQEEAQILKKRQASISGLFTAPGADLKPGSARRSINFKK